jgi:CHAT domain-containing protein
VHIKAIFLSIIIFLLSCCVASTQEGLGYTDLKTLQEYFHEEKYELLIAQADSLIDLYLDNRYLQSEMLNLKANSLRRVGRLEEALAAHHEVLIRRKQEQGVDGLKTANSLHNIGNCLLSLERPLEAFSFLEEALQIREKKLESPHDALAAIYGSLSSYYSDIGQYSKAEQLSKKALVIRRQIIPVNVNKIAGLQINLGNIYLDQDKPDSAFPLFQEVIDSLNTGDTLSAHLMAISHNGIANCWQAKGNLQKATLTYEQAIGIFESLEAYPLSMANCLNDYGRCLLAIGDAEQASYYFQRALGLLLPNSTAHPKRIANLYNNLALSLRYRKKVQQAIDYHEQAINLYLNNNLSPTEALAGYHSNIGKCYWHQKRFSAARYFFEKALNIQQELSGLAVKGQVNSLIQLGNCYLQEEKPQEAIKCFKKAKLLLIDGGKNDQAIAHLPYFSIGQSQMQQKLYTKALSNYERAIKCLPKAESYLYPKARIHTAKGDALLALAEQSDQPADIKAALVSYQQALTIVLGIQEQYENEMAALYLRDDFADLFQGLVASAIELGQYEAQYYHLAFQYSEQYKARLLRQAIASEAVEAVAGIPPTLLSEERDLQQQIYYLGQLCRHEEEKGPLADAQKLASWYEGQGILKRNLLNLKSRIREEYAHYYELKYSDEQEVKMSTLQKQLASDQSMLVYVLGQDELFAFILRKDTFVVQSLEKPLHLESQLIEWYYLLTTRPDMYANPDAAHQRYIHLAGSLYQDLWAPVSSHLLEKVIVVPDGLLHYIPFDAMIVEEPRYNHLFSKHDYLVRHYEISYAHAASLFTGETSRQQSGKWLGFAPSFKDDPRGLRYLDYNDDEVNTIGALYRGNTFVGDVASKRIFVMEAPQYQVLHVATHSVLNQESPEYSYLAFTALQSDSLLADVLFLYEVYNLRLSADLAILSACQTGIGQYHRGEGLMSIARAFTFSGAKSVISSLWSIDDRQTHQLMSQFYTSLADGLPKSAALRSAKLHYLSQNSAEQAHPYYWAAMVLNGDVGTVLLKRNTSNWWLWAALVLLVLGGVGYVVSRRVGYSVM